MTPEKYRTKIRAFLASGSLTLELSIPKGDLLAIEKVAEKERCYYEAMRPYRGRVKIFITRKPDQFYD